MNRRNFIFLWEVISLSGAVDNCPTASTRVLKRVVKTDAEWKKI
jgi:hypothetical protein